jgi:hypothetical protein
MLTCDISLSDADDLPTCAAVSNPSTADHSAIIAIRSVAYRVSKQCPWAQALLDFVGTRPAVVVSTAQARFAEQPSSALAFIYGQASHL